MATGLARFELPAALQASEPPEARGLTRDAVRMLVARRGSGELVHTRLRDLPCFLDEGDLLVINTSATLAAAIPATGPGGERFEVHRSTELPAGLWTVELRRGPSAWLGARQGQMLRLPGGARLTLLGPYATAGPGAAPRRREGSAKERLDPRRPSGATSHRFPNDAMPPSGGVRLWIAQLVLPAPLLAYLSRYGKPIRYGYVPGA